MFNKIHFICIQLRISAFLKKMTAIKINHLLGITAKVRNVLPMFYLKNQNPRKLFICKGLRFMVAVGTGLEPATPCVTGMYSNQAELPDRFCFRVAKIDIFSIG